MLLFQFWNLSIFLAKKDAFEGFPYFDPIFWADFDRGGWVSNLTRKIGSTWYVSPPWYNAFGIPTVWIFKKDYSQSRTIQWSIHAEKTNQIPNPQLSNWLNNILNDVAQCSKVRPLKMTDFWPKMAIFGQKQPFFGSKWPFRPLQEPFTPPQSYPNLDQGAKTDRFGLFLGRGAHANLRKSQVSSY